MAAAISALTSNFDDMLAVGLGIVVTDYVSGTVKGWIGAYVPTAWLDPVAEILIGIGILLLGEWFAPFAWKAYARLAAFGAIGLGIADAISTMLGRAHSSIRSSPSGGVQGASEGGVGFI